MRPGSLGWGLRVLRAYVRIGWVRKSQFRWEFVNQVVMDVLFYVSFILTFSILYGLDSGPKGEGLSMGGWSYAEMKVYMGMVFVADAVMMTFMGQQWHFGADLKNGALDPFKVRPGPTAFLYFFQRFSPEGLTNLVIASCWLVYALAGVVGSGGQVAASSLLWSMPCALAVILWSQTFLMISYNLVELWFMHSDIGHLASGILTNFAERPIDVYPRALSRVFFFVIPVAGLAWYPASLVLGELSPLHAALYPLVLIAFALLVTRVFSVGLRRYDSAMG